jgi:hypothetical protein
MAKAPMAMMPFTLTGIMMVIFMTPMRMSITAAITAGLITIQPLSSTYLNSASIGDHRMRIVHDYYNSPDPCGFSGHYYGQAVDVTFHVNVSSNMVLNWIDADQPNGNTLVKGSSDNDILRVNVNTTGSLSPLTASNFAFNTNGSTNASGDIVTAKLYYTGVSSVFNTGNLVGSYSGPSGAFTITPSSTLGNGNNYYWLAYDISSSGTMGDILDAEVTGVDVSSYGTQTSMTQAPAGSRTIDYCTVQPGTYYYGYSIISDITIGSGNYTYNYYGTYLNSTGNVISC